MKTIFAGNTAFLAAGRTMGDRRFRRAAAALGRRKVFRRAGRTHVPHRPDGTVDWYTYSGFRRYHSECHVCHGPDGLGSSFAPGLVEPLKTMSYDASSEVVVNGRESVTTSMQRKMPAFGYNKNVMCFIDDIYVYLKARADGALGRDRPPKQEPKPDAARAAETVCFGA